MDARQLDIFKGKRQRGERVAPPRELRLHIALADLVRRWIAPQWRFTHIPLGEFRDIRTAVRLKRMGAMPGWPDFIFVGPGQVLFLELKRRGEQPTEEQRDLAAHLVACGCAYLCTDSFDDAVDTLRNLGVVRARVSA